MKTYYGIVEDRQDPLKIGRVRVRVHHIHSYKKNFLGTPDLPWAQVMLPTTSAGLSGFGTQHGLVEGSTVILYFIDGEMCQQPVIIGAVAGIPQSGYRENTEDELMQRGNHVGFNDPRALTVDDYEGTPDGKNPDHSPTRGFGLTTAIDTAPKNFISREFSYDAKGSKIENETITKSDLPLYPRYYDKSDLSVLTDSSTDAGYYKQRDLGPDLTAKGITSRIPTIKSPAKPVYPYNKVSYSESGHILEIDDTLGVERLAIEHRSGTFHEIHPDGSQVTRIVNDSYTVICKDDEVYIGGTVNVSIGRDATMNVGGNLKADVSGTTDITSGKNLTIVAPEIGLHGTVVKLNS